MENRIYRYQREKGPKPIPEERRFSDVEAVTCGEGEASILDKFQDHPDHALIREKSQQLASEAAMPDSVISRCLVNKHGAGLLSLKKVLDILFEQNGLVHD